MLGNGVKDILYMLSQDMAEREELFARAQIRFTLGKMLATNSRWFCLLFWWDFGWILMIGHDSRLPQMVGHAIPRWQLAIHFLHTLQEENLQGRRSWGVLGLNASFYWFYSPVEN